MDNVIYESLINVAPLTITYLSHKQSAETQIVTVDNLF